jgi:hypothetical protein
VSCSRDDGREQRVASVELGEIGRFRRGRITARDERRDDEAGKPADR